MFKVHHLLIFITSTADKGFITSTADKGFITSTADKGFITSTADKGFITISVWKIQLLLFNLNLYQF